MINVIMLFFVHLFLPKILKRFYVNQNMFILKTVAFIYIRYINEPKNVNAI